MYVLRPFEIIFTPYWTVNKITLGNFLLILKMEIFKNKVLCNTYCVNRLIFQNTISLRIWIDIVWVPLNLILLDSIHLHWHHQSYSFCNWQNLYFNKLAKRKFCLSRTWNIYISIHVNCTLTQKYSFCSFVKEINL